MQDALHLKDFHQSNKPLLLFLESDSNKREKFIEAFTNLIDAKNIVFKIKAKTDSKPSYLIETLAKHWAVKLKKINSSYDEKLLEILHCLKQHNQKCVLLIDNAHLLPISMLAAICHLSYQQEKTGIAINTVLSGHKSLQPKINGLYIKEFARPPIIDFKSSHNKTYKNSVLTYIWENHRVKSTAIISLFVCGFSWWKLQSIHLSQPHNNIATHYIRKHHA